MPNAKPIEAVPLVNLIMDYETGELDDKRLLELFAELIRSGQAWSLQGSYGRTARDLIEAGLIEEDGSITEHAREILARETL